MARGRGGDNYGEIAGSRASEKGVGLTTKVEQQPGDGYAIWLEELSLYGMGDTLEEAENDLIEEVRTYMNLYREDSRYQNDPRRQHHAAIIALCEKAAAKGRLTDLVMARLPGVS